MRNLYIEVKVPPGSNIESACQEGIALSEKIGEDVSFSFNGFECTMNKDSNPFMVVSKYHKDIRERKKVTPVNGIAYEG